VVLGSGLRDGEALAVDDEVAARIAFVRGRLTARALGLPASRAAGDPGLLVRSLLPTRRRLRSGVLVLPHFMEYGSRSTRRALNFFVSAGHTVTHPARPPLEVAESVARADLLLTSSLHGMVFAHALGTPVQLVTFGESPVQPPFKYRDYLSVFGVDAQASSVHQVAREGTDDIRARAELDAARVDVAIDDVVDDLTRRMGAIW